MSPEPPTRSAWLTHIVKRPSRTYFIVVVTVSTPVSGSRFRSPHPLLHPDIILTHGSVGVRNSESVGERNRFVEGDTHL